MAVDATGAPAAGSKPVYDNYEISGCRRIDDAGRPNPGGLSAEPCGDGEPHFWTLYGHIHGQGAEAIGDFPSREAAEGAFYRITGTPFTGSREAHDRLRLMHAAPKLLEALEPYAIEARNEINWAWACDNDGPRGPALERMHRPLLEAYAAASVRPPGADAMARSVEGLLGSAFVEHEDRTVRPESAAVGRQVDELNVYRWTMLDRRQKADALRRHVNWQGFDHQDVVVVVRNILDGRAREEWFSGVAAPVVPGVEPVRPSSPADLAEGNGGPSQKPTRGHGITV